MFRMKERLPIEKKVFWNDLGAARKIYQHRAIVLMPDSLRPSPLEEAENDGKVLGVVEESHNKI